VTKAYVIYGGELSLFTRKLEAAMAFYGADFELQAKTPDNREYIESRAATHQVPVLKTPENWMLADTTPMLSFLDARFNRRAMFPDDELGVLVHVLEDYFDEWVSRVMVHYRWHYAASAKFAANRMTGGNDLAIRSILDWGPRACRATGTESQHQREAAEAEYLRILEAAESQLQTTSFLLGDRPTALDCAVLGGLRAHTNMDPDPKKIVAAFPTVVDWVERRAAKWDGQGELPPLHRLTPFAEHVLAEMPTTYTRFILGNRDALEMKSKAFHVDIYDEDVSFLTRPYPEIARNMINVRINSLDQQQQQRVKSLLHTYSINL